MTPEAPLLEAAASPEPLYDTLRPGPGRLTSEVARHQSERIYRAMIEISSTRSYDAVKVRDVARLARVSTRAFYELFHGKEDCFLRTHELLIRRAVRGIIVSQAGEHGWRERLDLVLAAFGSVLIQDPDAVCVAAVDAYSAGPAALDQARRAQLTIEAMIGETFARSPKGTAMPPLVVEGIVAAVAHLVRSRYLAGRERELPGLIDELREWVLCYPSRHTSELAELDCRSMSMRSAPQGASTTMGSTDDDRAIILTATAKLASAEGYRNLTIPRIRAGAGISRRRFNAHFTSVEDCFLAVLEQRSNDALSLANSTQIKSQTWCGGIYRGIVAICDCVANDPILIDACLVDGFPAGSNGSSWRKRFVANLTEQLLSCFPTERRPSDFEVEISLSAVWEVFHRHVIRGPRNRRPQIAAALSYMVLAPSVGQSAAIAAIRREQLGLI
jgi:AcrR family transcriptional regulator